jgi:Holliday junction resolvasome RuvABC ATP-dependent DNA helicase subunit
MRTQNELLFPLKTREERLWAVSPDNPNCPLNKFIGNTKPVRELRRAVFKAMERSNRACNDFSFALFGPASTGKTTLAELFADSLQLPFCVIQPQSTRRVQDVFNEIKKSLDTPVVYKADGWREEYADLSLVEVSKNHFVFPSKVVLIDEVHNLPRPVVQGLLKATEREDATMVTEEGIIVDCRNICWVIATTDRGGLFDAFDTRFEKLQLRLYSKKEVAKIINIANEDWSLEVCEIVSHYCSTVPREAKSFAKAMRIEMEMVDHNDWKSVASTVAEDKGVDEFGMTLQRVSVLKALGNRPISGSQLPHFTTPRCKEDELKNFVLPALQAVTPDQPTPLVVVSSKGYCITPAGLAELDKRGITNMGIEAIPESIRDSLSMMYEDAA